MDLRVFHQKIKATEAGIADSYVVVVSCETGDGGKAGVKTEVARLLAARMIAEGKARLADEAEVAGFRTEVAEARRMADEREAANGVTKLMVVSEGELLALKKSQKDLAKR